MTTIEILSWLVTLLGNPWGFVCTCSFSSIWSLQGICSCGTCVTTSPQPSSLANPALLTSASISSGALGHVLKSNVTDQMYSGSKPTQSPAQVPVLCITPMQCVRLLWAAFLGAPVWSCTQAQVTNWDFSIYMLAKNWWIVTLIKFSFSLRSLRAFFSILKCFSSLNASKWWGGLNISWWWWHLKPCSVEIKHAAKIWGFKMKSIWQAL